MAPSHGATFQRIQTPENMKETIAMELHRYSWSPHAVVQYESLWSILHKFTHLNAIEPSDVYRLLDKKNCRKMTHADRDLLSSFGRISREKLKTELGLPNRVIKYSVLDPYRIQSGQFNDHINQHESEVFRYCPQCLLEGFHTPLFQLTHVRMCPNHELPLKTECPNCQVPIAKQPARFLLKSPYQCNNCKHLLTTFFEKYVPRPAYATALFIKEYLSWKRKIENTLADEPVIDSNFNVTAYFDKLKKRVNQTSRRYDPITRRCFPDAAERLWPTTETNLQYIYLRLVGMRSLPSLWPPGAIKFSLHEGSYFEIAHELLDLEGVRLSFREYIDHKYPPLRRR
jgi:hypothetical protein